MAGSLTVQRMRVIGTAPASSAVATRCRAAIDGLDARRLGAALRRAFGDSDPDDRRVIVLRRLDIAIDAADLGDPDRIAAHLAEGIAALVARISASLPRSDGVVCFTSPADRLAAYLAARALGQPCDAWWFADFAPLAVLPLSSAIRTALMREAGIGLGALAAMRDSDRARVLARLGEVDTRLVAQALRGLPVQPDGDAVWNALTALPAVPSALSTEAAAIHLLAALASRMSPLVPDGSVLPVLELIVLASRAEARAILAAAIAAGSASRFAMLLPGAPKAGLAGLLRLPMEVRQAVADSLAVGDPAAAVRTGFTPFGGILLLYPHLPAFEGARLPDTAGEPGGVAALLALAALWGEREAALAIGDPMLQAIFAVDPRADFEAFAGWLGDARFPARRKRPAAADDGARLPPLLGPHDRKKAALIAAGRAAFVDFARKLPGFSGSSLGYLRANLLDIGAQVTITADTVRAVLERPPLDVLLGISGLADRTAPLPDGRTLALERAR